LIDERIRRPWPPEVLATVRRFRQGHLVESPPFSYVGSHAYPLWNVATADDSGGDMGDETWIDLAPEDRPRFGLITTQTCDLYEERPHPQQPWFMVCPVYDLPDTIGGRHSQIEHDRITHLIHVSGRSLPQGFWVGDLRIEFPIEKGWLVGRDPIEPWDTEPRYAILAERLAHRRDRPAVPNAVVELVVKPLREWLGGPGAGPSDSIDSIRLQVSGGPFDPKAARLLFLTNSEPLDEGSRTAIEEWWSEIVARAIDSGIALLGCKFATLDELTARELADSERLSFDHLSTSE